MDALGRMIAFFMFLLLIWIMNHLDMIDGYLIRLIAPEYPC